MTPRLFVYVATAALLAGGLVFAADAVVVSDQEALEALGEGVATGEPVDAVMRWTDTSRSEVSISGPDGRRAIFADHGSGLSEAMAAAFRPLEGSDREVIQDSVDIEGDRATVALRVRSGEHVVDATLRLRRLDEAWWVTSVRVRS